MGSPCPPVELESAGLTFSPPEAARMTPTFKLCYITDRRSLAPQALLPRIYEAVAAGVELIQIREKDLPIRELLALAAAAIHRARGTNTRIVVNDRLDAALALGAAGVHLGTQSPPPESVRGCVPEDFLVGVSCHSVDDAVKAEAAGADYVLLGPIFPTPTKLQYGPPLGLQTLQDATARVGIPILALGGINVERVKACVEAGAAGIAGISIFQECESLEDRVRALRKEFS
jgi:thiamine-phosphate pyrophosphorylase